MKKYISALLVLAMLLSGCGAETKPKEEPVVAPSPTVSGSENTPVPEVTAGDVAQYIIAENGTKIESLRLMNDVYEADAMAAYVENFYGLMPGEWTDCVIYRASASDNAFEVSVFKLDPKAESDGVLYDLEEYRIDRKGDFFGYNPAQADLVDDAVVCISDDGLWAGVFICSDADAARKSFDKRVGMSTVAENHEPDVKFEDTVELGELPSYWLPYVDPEADDMSIWDNSALVAAYKIGNAQGLNDKELQLLDEVKKVIDAYITEDMSNLEKEQAIYKWLCANCEYDYRHYELTNNAPRESYEPYGAIVEGTAVCLGFATAFQLFMDILDIECITVIGAAYYSSGDHAWNMVKIEDEWYCVDSTWDTGLEPRFFSFFNVSSEYMAITDHQWDYEAYPIAIPEETGDGMIHKLFNW